jgi:hypothetical protein
MNKGYAQGAAFALVQLVPQLIQVHLIPQFLAPKTANAMPEDA